MKQILFNNWSFFRVVRLLMGLVIIAQAVVARDALFGIAGFLFTMMALFNTGCCAAGSCNTSAKPATKKTSVENTPYEEVV